MNEEFDTCGCLCKNLKWVIPHREIMIELLSHGIEKWGVGRRWGVWVGCESNSTIAIDCSSEGQGQRAVGFFKHCGHDVGEGRSYNKRIVRGGWGGAGGQRNHVVQQGGVWVLWGHYSCLTQRLVLQ